MRVTIDTDVCIGAGQCVLTAPEVFTQDDDGFSALLPGCEDGTGDPMVREAARACPVRAITIQDQGAERTGGGG
ncbi:ferredoxin [Streptomyces aurantiacus]|uniref:Ferredoxin n=1 Tax=Streptomyces aurantiacus JA 4570 TaxID=1286094 RepID=S4AH37_9ACTN|nr:ferredoxin [Streptomyces aurantiacus]EPH40807.1 putative Ferredoxin soy [Streptomyces aurantiacus JA 4570]